MCSGPGVEMRDLQMNECLAILLAAYPLVLSAIAIYWQLSGRYRSRSAWAIRTVAASSIAVFAYLAAPWAFTSYYLRFILLGIFAAVCFYSYWRTTRRLLLVHASNISSRAPSVILLLLFVGLNLSAVSPHYYRAESLGVSFPLASGSFYVLQGGQSFATNPFHVLADSSHALDIVKLNAFGNRANGIAPRELTDYMIFGEQLRSPCAGSIRNVRDGLPDNRPGEPDVGRPEGNYIVLSCSGIDVLLAHLQRDSIRVRAGQRVAQGELLAKVGNSGNSMEPHLHIEAKRNSKGIGLVFDARVLSTNSLVRIGRVYP